MSDRSPIVSAVPKDGSHFGPGGVLHTAPLVAHRPALSVTRYVMLSDGDNALRLRATDMILGKLLPLRHNELERRLVDMEQVLRAIKDNSGAES